MEAEAKVSLNAEGFESGAQRVKRVGREMARDTHENVERVGTSMRGMQRTGVESGARVAGSMREIGHALRATTGEAGALHFGLREIAVSAGLGTAGVLALGAGVEIFRKLGEGAREAGREIREGMTQRAQFVSGPHTGEGEYMEQIKKLKENSDKMHEQSGSWVRRAWERTTQPIASVYATPEFAQSWDLGSQQGLRDKNVRGNDKQARELSTKMARNEHEMNDLRERGVQIGEKAVKVRELELERLQKATELATKGSRLHFNAQPLIDESNRSYRLQEKVAGQDYNSEVAQRASRSFDTMVKGESLRDVTPADVARFSDVGSVRTAQNHANDAQTNLAQAEPGTDKAPLRTAVSETGQALKEEVQRLKDRGALLEVQTKVLEYQENGQRALAAYTLKDFQNRQLVTQELRAGNKEFAAQLQIQQDISSVAERAAAFRESQNGALKVEAAQRAARDEVDAARFNDHGLTHDASRDGSLIRDANGPRGSRIPDAGQTGGAAAHALDLIGDNASIPNLPGIANFKGTANMFDRTSANRRLGKAHWARETMDRHRGDAAHDPARRLEDARIFRSKAQMREDQAHQFKRPGVAEQNRPNAPQKQQQNDHGIPELVGQMGKLIGQMQGLAAKIGVASVIMFAALLLG